MGRRGHMGERGGGRGGKEQVGANRYDAAIWWTMSTFLQIRRSLGAIHLLPLSRSLEHNHAHSDHPKQTVMAWEV